MGMNIAEIRKKKLKTQRVVSLSISLCYAMAVGITGAATMLDRELPLVGRLDSMLQIFPVMSITLIFLFINNYLHVCCHESGHMIFGLLTGYRFQSIRFGSFMIFKSDQGLKLARYSLSGTAGQCIMLPPAVDDEHLPVVMYNLGGIIINLLLSLLGFILYLLTKNNPLAASFFLISVITGIYLAILNGLPLSSLGNDGYNTLVLSRDIKSRRAFRISLLTTGALAENRNLTDLPEDWFRWEYSGSESALSISMGVTRIYWLLYQDRISEAGELAQLLLDKAENLVAIHETQCWCEKIYCATMLGDPETARETMKQQEKNLKAMTTTPSIQRTLVSYYHYADKDEEKAAKAEAAFEKLAEKYPYRSELEAERTLMKREPDHE